MDANRSLGDVAGNFRLHFQQPAFPPAAARPTRSRACTGVGLSIRRSPGAGRREWRNLASGEDTEWHEKNVTWWASTSARRK